MFRFTRFFTPKKAFFSDTQGFAIEDKPVPLMGKILLLIMFFLLLFLGWRGLSDIYRLLTTPSPISSCLWQFTDPHSTPKEFSNPLSPYEYRDVTYDSDSGCRFSALEKKYDAPQAYAHYQQAKMTQDALSDQLRNEQNSLVEMRRDLLEKQREYDLSLQEVQANTSSLYEHDSLKNDISSLESTIAATEARITELTTSIETERQLLVPFETKLKTIGAKITHDYNRTWGIYRLKVLFLQLAFVIPIFFLSFKLYWRFKYQDSPYTRIVVPIVAVSAILLARISLSYIWTLFLADILATIWQVIQKTALLRILIFYVGMVLVIVIFGGSVYLLQRKIFHPLRVQKRRLKKNTCPFCETPLSLSQNFCPECGKKLRSKCAQCQALRLDMLRFCPHCGHA